MSSKFGVALPIIVINETNGKPELITETLEAVFLNPSVVDSNIALISANGPFRKGKSFLLNRFLHYLDLDSEGFESRKGTASITKGLIVWSKPITMFGPNDEPLSIFLIDTEGLFDANSVSGSDHTIFALSALLSSVQIYLFASPLQTSEINCFREFVQFAERFATIHGDGDTPFQTLLFLLKDWVNPDEFTFGYDGGMAYLKHIFNAPNYRELGQGIFRSFDTKCFLLPYPGEAVASNTYQPGHECLISPVYTQQLNLLAHSLFEQQQPKLLNGQPMNGAIFCEYAQSLVEALQVAEVINPKSLFNILADKTAKLAVENQLKNYSDNIQIQIDLNVDEMANTDILVKEHHNELLQTCIFNFQTAMKGFEKCDDVLTVHQWRLWQELDELHEQRLSEQSSFLVQSSEFMTQLKASASSLIKAFQEWKIDREQCINQITDALDEIPDANLNSKRVELISSSAALAVSIASVACIFIPAVGPLVATGFALVAGTATSIGSNVGKTKFDNKRSESVDETEKSRNKDALSLRRLQNEIEAMIELAEQIDSVYCQMHFRHCNQEQLENLIENLDSALQVILATNSEAETLNGKIEDKMSQGETPNPVEEELAKVSQSAKENLSKIVPETKAAEPGFFSGAFNKLKANLPPDTPMGKNHKRNVRRRANKRAAKQCANQAEGAKTASNAGSYAAAGLAAFAILYDVYCLGKSIHNLTQEQKDEVVEFLNTSKAKLEKELVELSGQLENAVANPLLKSLSDM